MLYGDDGAGVWARTSSTYHGSKNAPFPSIDLSRMWGQALSMVQAKEALSPRHCRSPRPLIPSARLAMWSERTTGSTSTSGRRAKGCRELPDIGVWSSSHLIRMSNTPATHLTSRIARNGTRCWYAFHLTHQKRGMRVENDGRILTCATFSRPHTN